MAKFKDGITDYAIGYARIKVAFPNGDVRCRNCEYLSHDRGLNRCYCKLQHSKLILIEFIDFVDDTCPIEF